MTMRFGCEHRSVPLQCGDEDGGSSIRSNGNCIYVEADGVRLLFDAGISGRQVEQRLAAHGRDIRDVDALVISHDQGHLANGEAAKLLRTSAGPRLQWVCLGHLSEENNHPELAIQSHREMLGDQMPLFLASRDAATDVLEV